jgi:hypothetical protein
MKTDIPRHIALVACLGFGHRQRRYQARWENLAYGDWFDPIVMEPNGSQFLYCLHAEGTFDD